MTRDPIPPLDGFRLLTEMAAAGVNNAEVARRLGIQRSTVMRWKAGSEPCWSTGERLRLLHEYVTRDMAQNATPM